MGLKALFSASKITRHGYEIDRTLNTLNRKLGRNVVRYAAMGLNPSWAMRQENHSGRFTTRWDELPTAKA